MPEGLPRLIFLLALCGGGAVWLVFRNVRRGSLRRLRGVLADDGASAAVEMPYVLLVLVTLVTLTWQLIFIMTAYVYMDHVAYVSARCAAVTIPDRMAVIPGGRSLEVENVIAPPHDTADFYFPRTKMAEIRSAAVLASIPIAGWGDGSVLPAADLQDPASLAMIPGRLYEQAVARVILYPAINGWGGMTGTRDRLRDLKDMSSFWRRYSYASANTHVQLITPDLSIAVVGTVGVSDFFFAAGETVTVEVTHYYELQVPYARRILGKWREIGDGGLSSYTYKLKARASFLNEGYLGDADGLPAGTAR